ncbi:MAG: 50S ribosomal protein L24 [Candidatus Dormibacteraeota bacterium]|uniref:Large ribosomal subunit protein uL24 n=1 Tax=Candidatus Amunia macphersoniae TaxID=3127014 RepID=A0A934NJS9_9BACT|nr:50S ribosomal protein L24 [Candidatus Dormibacteraeota bacterium]
MALVHRGWSQGRDRLLDIRAGDTVEAIAGKDKGKRGLVVRSIPATQRIVVEGINRLKRHTKSGAAGNIQGGIVDFNAPIAYSNVMLVCNRCDKPTRISRVEQPDGSFPIVCKQCGEIYVRNES